MKSSKPENHIFLMRMILLHRPTTAFRLLYIVINTLFSKPIGLYTVLFLLYIVILLLYTITLLLYNFVFSLLCSSYVFLVQIGLYIIYLKCKNLI
ncbi:hypothetical protein QJS10_CPA16g00196 [Acorus calamus]|uniref:Uncharacterized protein n=1 Tax=Acorus calamus TaxID=4465 RepID=A0AAV9CY84_ACOCL|nr:hypothetical protein QJS10_CPA16g00196 [Acorus calamus]